MIVLWPRRRSDRARKAGCRPTLESLEGRLVLSTAALHIAAAPAAQVSTLAAGTLAISQFAVQNGQLVALGSLGVNSFAVPVSAQVVPAARRNASPVVNLSISPIGLNLSGLAFQTSPVSLRISATGRNALLVSLAGAAADPNTLAAALNSVAGQAGGVITLGGFAAQGNRLFTTGTLLGKSFRAPTTSQLLPPVAGVSPTVVLTVTPITQARLGLRVQSSRVSLVVNAPVGTTSLLGNLLFGLTGTNARLPKAPTLASLLNQGLASLGGTA